MNNLYFPHFFLTVYCKFLNAASSQFQSNTFGDITGLNQALLNWASVVCVDSHKKRRTKKREKINHEGSSYSKNQQRCTKWG